MARWTRRSGGRTGRAGRPATVSVAVLVARFTAAGAVVLIVLAAALALAARQQGTEQAVDSAKQVTQVAAETVVEPRLDDRLVAGDRAVRARLDAAVRRYVLRGSLVRVKIWAADGRVLYSDEPRLEGARFALGSTESAVLAQQTSNAEVSDLERPENRFEKRFGKLLEVYVGVRTSAGTPLLFETYFRYDAVRSAGLAAWRTFAPPALGALLLLELVQVPFAWSMARRLQRGQAQREQLLRDAVEGSTAERRRIAGELHDGVVQELTGITYLLDASRRDVDGDGRRRQVVAESAHRLRSSIASLRSMLVDIYPPNLAEEGLPSALEDLAAGLERRGVRVDLHLRGVDGIPEASSRLVYRAVQEASRNVLDHSGAEHVEISCVAGPDATRLVIDDDGRGFDTDTLSARADVGHVGLRTLGDLVRDMDGRLVVRSAPGQGTRIEIEVPTR